MYFFYITVFDKAIKMSNHEIILALLSNKKTNDMEKLLKMKMDDLKLILKHFGYELIRNDEASNEND